MEENSLNDKDRDILIRLDERSAAMKEKLDQFIDSIPKTYTTKEEFDPVKRIVYGLVTLALVAVASAIIKGVVTG